MKKTDRRNLLMLLSIVAIIVVISSITYNVYATDTGEEDSNVFSRCLIRRIKLRSLKCARRTTFETVFNLDLTDVQREEIKQLIEDMLAADATREEIMSAIKNMLDNWGIEVPQCPDPNIDRFRGLTPSWAEELTDEQKGELRRIRRDMMEQTRRRISDKLEEWGIEVP